MATMPLGWRHIRVVLVASLGQFIGQGLATLVGIVIPLMQLVHRPELSSAMQGILGCISLIGIMLGTVVIGRLSDRYGYLLFFRLCPAVIVAASLATLRFHDTGVLLGALFIMGFAIGGEYSLDPDYISELMPDKWKIFMVGVAKALASAGSAVVALVCYILIRRWNSAEHWDLLFLIMTAIAALMLILRMNFTQSPGWLLSRGEKAEALAAARKLLGPDVTLPPEELQPKTAPVSVRDESIWSFIRRNWDKVVLTGFPWACEGLGVYGIGIFLPMLIIAFGLSSDTPDTTPIEHITNSIGTTTILAAVMMVGFSLGIALLHKFNHLRMQSVGFWGSAVGLGLLLAAYMLKWPGWIAITGFIIFELFLNAGPHLITFILPSKTFAVGDRGTGSGIAAGLGKTGAVLGAFVIPVMLRAGGAELVLGVSIAVMALGALITSIVGRKVED